MSGGHDDLRASDVATAWRTLWVDRARGSMGLLAVAADGTLWTTFWEERERGSALEGRDGGLRRWDGRAWRTSEIPALPHRGPQSTVALAAASADRAWAFGYSNDGKGADTSGFIGTYDSGRWRAEALTKPAADAPWKGATRWLCTGTGGRGPATGGRWGRASRVLSGG